MENRDYMTCMNKMPLATELWYHYAMSLPLILFHIPMTLLHDWSRVINSCKVTTAEIPPKKELQFVTHVLVVLFSARWERLSKSRNVAPWIHYTMMEAFPRCWFGADKMLTDPVPAARHMLKLDEGFVMCTLSHTKHQSLSDPNPCPVLVKWTIENVG